MMITGSAAPIYGGHVLVEDAASQALEAKLLERQASGSDQPIYTYPSNGRRKLTEKPLTRAEATKAAAAV